MEVIIKSNKLEIERISTINKIKQLQSHLDYIDFMLTKPCLATVEEVELIEDSDGLDYVAKGYFINEHGDRIKTIPCYLKESDIKAIVKQ